MASLDGDQPFDLARLDEEGWPSGPIDSSSSSENEAHAALPKRSNEKKLVKSHKKKVKHKKHALTQIVPTVTPDEPTPSRLSFDQYPTDQLAYDITKLGNSGSFENPSAPPYILQTYSNSSKKSRHGREKRHGIAHEQVYEEGSDDNHATSSPADGRSDLVNSSEVRIDLNSSGGDNSAPTLSQSNALPNPPKATTRSHRHRLHRSKKGSNASKLFPQGSRLWWNSSYFDDDDNSSGTSLDLTPYELAKIRRTGPKGMLVPPIFSSPDSASSHAHTDESEEEHHVELDLDGTSSSPTDTEVLANIPIPKYPIEELIPFLTLLAKTFHSYGAPVNRTEWNMAEVSDALGIQASYSVMPTVITITFGLPEGMDAVSRTIRCDQNLVECGRLYLVEKLIQSIRSGELDLYDARKQLYTIIARGPAYHRVWRLASFAGSAGSAAIVCFNGGWIDLLVATMLGLIVGLLDWIGELSVAFGRVSDIMSGLVVAAVCLPVSAYIPKSCFSGLILSSVVWLLPGLTLTVAVRELATKNMVAGTVRIFGAFMTSLKLGLGIAFGSQLPFWVPKGAITQACTNTVNPYWRILFFFTTVIPFNILLDTDMPQWPGQILTSGVGYVISWLCSTIAGLPSELCAVIAAFGVGIVGNLYSLVSHNPGVVYIFSGIALLVPGSIGVRGATSFFQNDAWSGVQFSFTMVIIGFCITVGTLVADLIIFPKKNMIHRAF